GDSRRQTAPSKPSVPSFSSGRLALVAAAHDQPIRRLVVPGLLALGRLAPRRDGVPATRAAALAAAMRVVDRVHRDAAHRRPAAKPAIPAGFADNNVLLIRV